MLTRLRSALAALFGGARFRRELDEEMDFHIERLTEDLVRSGLSPEEARRQARLRFGSREGVQYRSREARGVALLDEAFRNARFALRGMARNPLFTTTFVLTLGVCIGAGTAVYSVVDAVLWRPLPYPESDRLAQVVRYDPERGPNPGASAVTGSDWERIRDGADFLQAAVYSGWRSGVNLTADAAAAYVRQQRVGAGFFRTLGVAPLIGRGFEAAEDVPGGPALTVLSYELWARTFGQDPEIVGRTIRLKGEAHTVVGVMPENFHSSRPVDVWTPLRPSPTGEGAGTNYHVVTRIPQAMSWAEADARVGGIEAAQPDAEEAPDRRYGLVPLKQTLTWEARQPLLILLGAILVMLLVGSANLAGLQVARALARRTEIATRQALGGGAGAILRQMLAESVTLAASGGLLGLAIAWLGMGGLEVLVRTHFSDTWQTISIDGRVLAAAVGLTFVATLFFGLAPMLQIRKFDVRGILAGGARGVVGGTGHYLRRALVVGEVALVTALLFAAGLLVRSYGHLDRLDPGFDPEGVMTVRLSLDDARYASAADVVRLLDESLTEIRRIPGVSAATVALSLPYERPLNMPFRIVGVEDPPGRYRITNVVYVTPGFFETLGIPLLRGRDLEVADAGDRPPVVLPNQAFVEANLEDRPALGSSLTFAGREWEIVGVVGDVQQSNAGWGGSQPVWRAPTLYIPAAQASDGFFSGIHIWFAPSWLVKTSGNPPGLAAAVVGAIHNVDPDLPPARITSLEEVMARALARPRFEAAFLVVVAAFALLLAVVGLYGIVANEVEERTPEMGLRMALGAAPNRAVWAVGLRGLQLTLIGLALGGLLAAVAASWISSLIWGVAPYDPLTLAFVASFVTALAGAASFVPAARIARLDPSRILREE